MSTTAQIQEIYVGLLGRAADAEGLAYWKAEIDGGVLTIEQLRANIVNEQPEWQSGLGTLSREDLVKALYDSMFNRAPEAEGLEYWTTGGGSEVNADQLVLALSNGASSEDRLALNNKTEAAEFYTSNVATYTPTIAAAAVSSVDGTLASVNSSKAASAALSADGSSQSLTTSADTLTGNAGTDFFTAELLTLGSGDSISGGAGTDYLVGELNADLGSTVSVDSIEYVQLTAYGAKTIDMTNWRGVEEVRTVGSTGAITLSNNGDATTALAFQGSGSNTMTSSYTAGALDGTSDVATVNLKSATSVSVTFDAGFESAAITTSGTNDIDTFAVPGIGTVTLTGSGSVEFADTTLDGITTLFGQTSSASVTTGTVSSSTGYADADIVGSTSGASILLGSGDDSIGFTAAGAAAANTSTVKLGSGNDQLVLNAAGSAGVSVFGEHGDDKIQVTTTATGTDDVIDGGAGTDTVLVDVDGATLVMKSVENLIIDSTGGNVATTINASDVAQTVILEVGTAETSVTGLKAGSTVTINDGTSDGSEAAENVTIGFASTEAASTITSNANLVDIITINNVAAATLVANDTITLAGGENVVLNDKVTSFTINSAEAIDLGDGLAAGGDKLETFTVVGAKSVDVGGIANDAVLSTISVSAATGNVTMGAMADADKLSSLTLTSTAGTVTAGEIGDNGGTTTDPDRLATVSVSAAKGLTLGIIEADDIGTITASTATGTARVDKILSADELGTVSITATDGAIDLGDGTVGIVASHSDGITVNLTAKTFISDDGADVGDDALVQNTGGNITATIAGAAAANVNYTTVTSGLVNLTATNTGGLTSTITNTETAGDGDISTIILGNAASGKTNAIILDGTIDTVNVTGGSGSDTLAFEATSDFHDGTFAMGGGFDTIDFTNIEGANRSLTNNSGIVVNLGTTTKTFNSGESYESSVASGRVAEYDDTGGTTAAAQTDVIDFAVTGVEKVIGTAEVDYLIASNTGTTFQGGEGADTIVLGAGSDTLMFTASNGADTIGEFTAGATNGDVLNFNALLTSDGTVTEAPITATASGTDVNDAAGKVFLIKLTGETDLDDAAEVAAFFATDTDHGRDYLQMGANTDGEEVGIVLTGATSSRTVYVWEVNNSHSNMEVTTDEVTLIGTVTLSSGDIDSLTSDNFSFSA
jgi:hypothetical protein